ncbi:MAG: DUF2288 domain-containing protein [Verrucomicrobiales bacterium]|nr:DUF2288 domain-containing protein [Verrucomicrobiales bacterium]
MSKSSNGSSSSNGNTPAKEDGMVYGMLGDDDLSTAEKLEKYTGVVGWKHLEPHYKNEALLWLDPSLDLTTVGEAIANDDTEKVRAWKESGDLVTPSTPHAFYWEESKATFRALVVSPFVLIQPTEETPDE